MVDENCELLVIKKNDFLAAFQKYKEYYQELYEIAVNRENRNAQAIAIAEKENFRLSEKKLI